MPPQPVLKQKSAWLDFFTTEEVELKCSIPDISDWVITWMKDATVIKPDLSASADGSVLTIASVTTADSGSYTCRGRHRTKTGVNTNPSNSLSVSVTGKFVYGSSPVIFLFWKNAKLR